MSIEPETERPSNEGESAPRSVRRITFDDFEIEAGANASDDSASHSGFLKNAIPRIRSMKDDLLGGGKKIFGSGKPESSEAQEQSWHEAQPVDPLSAPYFSDEERSLIRVKKIPKAE